MVYTNPILIHSGGVQRVSADLAAFLKAKGHSVIYLSLHPLEQEPNSKLENQFILPDNGSWNTKNNVKTINYLVRFHRITNIINQAALDIGSTKLVSQITLPQVNVLSVIHNSPMDFFYNLPKLSFGINRPKFLILGALLKCSIVKQLLTDIYIQRKRVLYNALQTSSDGIVLLSNAFSTQLNIILKDNYDNSKYYIIPNPVKLSTNYIAIEDKIQEILYVGRIDFNQKRIDLLFKVWSKICDIRVDWRLTIVGDGVETETAKQLAVKMKLINIKFEGRQDPDKYYNRASILFLTSAYEGFGLVIVEAQAAGVVPILFDSYASASDLVHNEKTGLLIEAFSVDQFVAKALDVMNNNAKRIRIAESAQLSAKRFSYDEIGKKWLTTLEENGRY